MKMKQIIILLAGVAIAGVAAIGAFVFYQFKLDDTTLSVELTAEGQPVAPGEVPKLFGNEIPLSNAAKVKPGKVLITSQSDIFRDVKQDIQVELGKANTVRIDLKYRTGSIEVETDPSGADVFQAGKSLGRTPLKLADERVGPHQYSLSLRGWKDAILRGRVEDGKNVKLTYRFPYGNISFTSEPAGAVIKQDGHVLGNTPFEVKDMPAGDISVELALEGWPPVQVTGRLGDGKNLQLSHHFPNGSITITSDPAGATVKQGDRVLGSTPVELKGIPEGSFTCALEMKDHRGQSVEGRVQDNQNLRLSAKLVSFQEEAQAAANAARDQADKARKEEEARQKEIAERERANKIKFYTTTVYGRWTGSAKYHTGFFKQEECPQILLIELQNEFLHYSIITPKKQVNNLCRIKSINNGRVYAENIKNTNSSIMNLTFTIDILNPNSGTLVLYTEEAMDGLITVKDAHGNVERVKQLVEISFKRDLSYIK